LVKVFEEELIVPTKEQAHHFGNWKSIATGRGDPPVTLGPGSIWWATVIKHTWWMSD